MEESIIIVNLIIFTQCTKISVEEVMPGYNLGDRKSEQKSVQKTFSSKQDVCTVQDERGRDDEDD